MASADIDIDSVVNALLKEYGYKEPEPREDTAGAGSTAAHDSPRTGPDANVLARLAERRAAADQRKEVYCEVCGLVRVKAGGTGVPACERCYKRMAVLREGRKEAIEFYSDPRNTRRASRRVKKYIQDILSANQQRDLEIREEDIPPRPASAAEKPAPAPVEEKPAAPAAAAAPSRAGRLSAAEILAQFEETPAEKKPAAPAEEKSAAPTPAPTRETPAASKPAAPAPAPAASKPATPAPAPAASKPAAPAPVPAAAKPAAPVSGLKREKPAAAEEPSIDELLARIGEFPEEEELPVSRSERRHMAEASISRIERRAAEMAAPRTERAPVPAPTASRSERHSPGAVSRRASRPAAAPAAPAPSPTPSATAVASSTKGKPPLEEMLTPIGGPAGPLSAREEKKPQQAAPAAPRTPRHGESAAAPVTETPRPAAEKPNPVPPTAEKRLAAHTAPEATAPAPKAAEKPSLEEMLTPIGGAQETGLSRRNRKKSASENSIPAVKQPEAEIPVPAPKTAKHSEPEHPEPAPAPVAEKLPKHVLEAVSKPAERRTENTPAPRAAERTIDEILSGIELPEEDTGADIPTEEMLARAENALQDHRPPRMEREAAPAPRSRMAERRMAQPDADMAPAPARAASSRQDERMARKAYRPAFSLNRVCQACGADEWVGIDGAYSYIELCNNCEKRKVEFKKQDYVDSFECPYCGGLTGTREENKRKFGVRCSNCGELTICFQKVDELLMDEKLTAALTGYAKALVSDDVTCPRCGSESITTGTKGIAFLGIGKPVNRCARCGYTWTPEWSVG